jgi:tetratricopeptide (TPR) repeat protein
MTRSARFALPLLGALAAIACRSHPAPASGSATRTVRTTDGAVAMGNLDVQIVSEERRLSRDPRDAVAAASLVELLLTRAQVTATVDDVDRAAAHAARATVDAGGRVLLARAAVHAALHRFADAIDDLALAERQGADSMAVRAQRASVAQAQGHLGEALGLRRELASARRSTTSLAQLAISEAALGDAASAAAHLDEALAAYRDTSPLPVAWIEFQRGMMADVAGELDAAASHYGAAFARLPQYAEAAGHLATIEALRGRPDRAEALLRPFAAPGRDPQYAMQLASVLETRGARREAARLRQDALARYDLLLARHPEAYADHAARFLLGTNPQRSLALAQVNLAVRQTWEAYDLALAAARAARAFEQGCRVAADALGRPSPPARIRLAADRALDSCRSPRLGEAP